MTIDARGLSFADIFKQLKDAVSGLAFIDVAHIPPAPGGLRCRGLITAVDNSRVQRG